MLCGSCRGRSWRPKGACRRCERDQVSYWRKVLRRVICVASSVPGQLSPPWTGEQTAAEGPQGVYAGAKVRVDGDRAGSLGMEYGGGVLVSKTEVVITCVRAGVVGESRGAD